MPAMGISSTQIQHEIFDIPQAVLCERRRFPDRRTVWRGGRRDTDWIDRPSGAWGRFEAEQRRTSRFTPLLKQPARLRSSIIAALLFLANVTATACSNGPTAPAAIGGSAPQLFGVSVSRSLKLPDRHGAHVPPARGIVQIDVQRRRVHRRDLYRERFGFHPRTRRRGVELRSDERLRRVQGRDWDPHR